MNNKQSSCSAAALIPPQSWPLPNPRDLSVIASAFNTASGNRLSWSAPGQYVVMQGLLRHLVLRVDLDAIGGSALTTDIEVPKDRS